MIDFSTNLGAEQSLVTPTTRVGPVRVNVTFASPTEESISMFVYGTYPSAFTVDHMGKVETDFLTA